jgi:hypothetical protein
LSCFTVNPAGLSQMPRASLCLEDAAVLRLLAASGLGLGPTA